MKKTISFVLLNIVVGWLFSYSIGKVQAGICRIGTGVFCAATNCGVWYDPPDNCVYDADQCWYFDPDDLRENEYTGPGGGGVNDNYFPPCDDTINCRWHHGYNQCRPEGSNTNCC